MTEPQVAQEIRHALSGRAAPRFRRLAGNRLPGSDWMSTLIAYPATEAGVIAARKDDADGERRLVQWSAGQRIQITRGDAALNGPPRRPCGLCP